MFDYSPKELDDTENQDYSQEIVPCREENKKEVQFSNSHKELDDTENQLKARSGEEEVCDQEGGKLKINKTKIHRAKKMIRGAYVELFKGMVYLQTYWNLNMLAFVKILKKFDKVTGKQILPINLKLLESSYLYSSDKAVQLYQAIKLMNEVEELFVKHFAEDDKKKAMKYLKPRQCKESHSTTFFTGFFTACFACFVALFVAYCVVANKAAGMYTQMDSVYRATVYPVFDILSLLFLPLFLYGCNNFMWRKTRINYKFIFEFALLAKDLKYMDVFFICSVSMAAVVGVMFAYLCLLANGYSSTEVQVMPGILLLMFLVVLVSPLNIVYRSSRYNFLRILKNIILSSLYKVVMVDFYVADQLCSQVHMLRSLEYIACYYVIGV